MPESLRIYLRKTVGTQVGIHFVKCAEFRARALCGFLQNNDSTKKVVYMMMTSYDIEFRLFSIK